MTDVRQILALDLAARTGWALGATLDRAPQSGSVQFARTGASMAAILSGCRRWLDDFLIVNPAIKIVVFEAPLLSLHLAGRTNVNTSRILIGLAAVVEELLCSRGGYDVREARVSDVRSHFIGSNRHKRAEAKALTIAACRRLGWLPVVADAAAALALWHYQAAILDPRLALQTSPLFRRGS